MDPASRSGERAAAATRAATLPIAHRRSPVARARAARAFTLLELLMVMAVIAILATITLLIGRGVSDRSKVTQARAEMAVLAAALEQYKQQYGDYPWTPADVALDIPTRPLTIEDSRSAVVLFNALCGNLGPKAVPLLDAGGASRKGRTFVDISKFRLWLSDSQLPDPELPTIVNNWFADPWGKWYYYYYKKGASDGNWKSKGFLLYSHGPDGECRPGPEEDSGLLDEMLDTPEAIEFNRDNLYYGRD